MAGSNIFEIDFSGNLKCQIEIEGEDIKVLKAINGFGTPIDCNYVTVKKIL